MENKNQNQNEVKVLRRSTWKKGGDGVRTSRVILTTWNKTTPFVTHIEFEEGDKIGGQYFTNREDADMNFESRMLREEVTEEKDEEEKLVIDLRQTTTGKPVHPLALKLGWCGMVATYDDFKVLQAYADNYAGSEKVIAHLFILMAVNTMAHLVAPELDELRKQNKEYGEEIVVLNAKLEELQKENEHLEEEKAVAERSAEEAEDEKNEAEDERDEIQEKLDDITHSVETARRSISDASDAIEEVFNNL